MTVYEQSKEQGLETDSHESDLYLKDCEEARHIIANSEFPTNSTRFRNQIDGAIWWDVPFAFDPWWERKERTKNDRTPRT